MKFDNIEIQQCESVEEAPVERKIRRKRKINVLDFVIVQLVLGVAISAIVLTAQVVTTVGASRDKGAAPTAAVTAEISDMY